MCGEIYSNMALKTQPPPHLPPPYNISLLLKMKLTFLTRYLKLLTIIVLRMRSKLWNF